MVEKIHASTHWSATIIKVNGKLFVSFRMVVTAATQGV